MADRYSDKPGLKWIQIKIKTLVFWGATLALIIGGILAFLYIKENYLSPDKRAASELEKARNAYARLEKIENLNEVLLDTPAKLLDEAEEAYKVKNYEEAAIKAERSYKESSIVLERLQEADKGYKSAYFVSIEGQVSVRKKDTQEWSPAKEKMPLYAGDYVKTGRNSGALVMLFDGSQYFIKEDSLVLIQQSFEDPASRKREIAIKIDDGQVDVTTAENPYAESSTTVSTPSATTVFKEKSDSAIEYNKDTGETAVSIYSGKAKMTAGDNTLNLNKEEKVKVSASQKISAPIKLLTPPDLIAPPHREIYETENPKNKIIQFAWSGVGAASKYRVEIANSAIFINPTTKDTTKTSLSLRGFDYGSYFWRVFSIDSKGNPSKYSTPLQFSLREKSQVDLDDKEPPPLQITAAYQLGEYFLITGLTEPGAQLTVNNIQWDVQSDGSFKDILLLKNYGINIVTFRSVDNAGNATVEKIKLELK